MDKGRECNDWGLEKGGSAKNGIGKNTGYGKVGVLKWKDGGAGGIQKREGGGVGKVRKWGEGVRWLRFGKRKLMTNRNL